MMIFSLVKMPNARNSLGGIRILRPLLCNPLGPAGRAQRELVFFFVILIFSGVCSYKCPLLGWSTRAIIKVWFWNLYSHFRWALFQPCWPRKKNLIYIIRATEYWGQWQSKVIIFFSHGFSVISQIGTFFGMLRKRHFVTGNWYK